MQLVRGPPAARFRLLRCIGFGDSASGFRCCCSWRWQPPSAGCRRWPWRRVAAGWRREPDHTARARRPWLAARRAAGPPAAAAAPGRRPDRRPPACVARLPAAACWTPRQPRRRPPGQSSSPPAPISRFPELQRCGCRLRSGCSGARSHPARAHPGPVTADPWPHVPRRSRTPTACRTRAPFLAGPASARPVTGGRRTGISSLLSYCRFRSPRRFRPPVRARRVVSCPSAARAAGASPTGDPRRPLSAGALERIR